MLLRIAVSAALFLATSFGQVPAGPRFEVVAIRSVPQPTPETILSGGSRPAFNVDGARVRITGYPVLSLVTRAFRVESRQVDSRGFAGNEYFEIQATLPEAAKPEQVPEMLQAMLAERFKLDYHRETRRYESNVLTVGKNGMKLPRLPNDTPSVYGRKVLGDGTTRITQVGKISSFFPVMNSFGGLQLVDETGLDGIYTWVQDEPPITPTLSQRDGLQESFRAMIEAAGLKMETRKVPKETIVVDHLEKTPTGN